jgi:hypothetical protein
VRGLRQRKEGRMKHTGAAHTPLARLLRVEVGTRWPQDKMQRGVLDLLTSFLISSFQLVVVPLFSGFFASIHPTVPQP